MKKMNIASLSEKIREISSCLLEHKAQEAVCLDISQEYGGGLADCLYIVTASSPRHARSLADALAELCHQRNFEYRHVEGYTNGEWVLVDLNDIVIHIFLAEKRELYKLEELWGRNHYNIKKLKAF